MMRTDPVAVHVAGWIGLMVAAIANAGLREGTFGRWTSRDVSHNISVVPLIGAILGWPVALARYVPLATRKEASAVARAWLAMTLAFEFGFGRAEGLSWKSMLGEYNIAAGRLWVLVPIAIVAGPVFAYRRGE